MLKPKSKPKSKPKPRFKSGLPEILPPIYDIVFKQIFVKRPDLLGPFLKSVIGLPDGEFEKIVVADPHIYPEHADEKMGVLDIKVVLKSKKVIDVEMQQKKLEHLRERVLFYCSGMVMEQTVSGGGYENIKRVVSITITNHAVLAGDGAYHHRYTLYDPETRSEFTDLLEVHILELPKLPKEDDGSDLWGWMKFLTVESKEELAMIASMCEVLAKAANRLEEVSADKRTRLRLESELKYEMDQRVMMKEAVAASLAEGREEGIEAVFKLLEKGVSLTEAKEILHSKKKKTNRQRR